VGVAEVPEGVRLIVAQRVHSDARCVEVLHAFLQLDQLRTAGGSPDGGTEENDYRGSVATMFLEIERRPVGISATYVGYVFANGGPSGKVAPGVTPWSRAWPNRPNETVVILPAFPCLCPARFQLWLRGVLRVLIPPVYTEGLKLWTAYKDGMCVG
jgi:hypothetical protein